MIDVAIQQGAARDRADGGREVLWRDGSGASMAVDTAPDGGLICVRPSFLGTSRIPVRANGIAEDPECRFCSRLLVDVLDDDGEMLYPLAVELEEIGAVLEAPPNEEPRSLRVTAFAGSIEAWTDEGAYAEASAHEEAPMATQSLIPVGLFAPPAERRLFRRRAEPVPTATALMTGIVTSVSERRNEQTGEPFVWAQIDTYGGRYDAAVAAAETEGLAVGGVARLESWLIGSLSRPATG